METFRTDLEMQTVSYTNLGSFYFNETFVDQISFGRVWVGEKEGGEGKGNNWRVEYCRLQNQGVSM